MTVKSYKFRNAIFNKNSDIDMEIEHPSYGWIPYTASKNDVEPMGKVMWDKAFLSAKPHVPLPEVKVMPSITPRQLWLVAAHINITKQQVLAHIDSMFNEQEAMLIKIEIEEAISFEYDHPVVSMIKQVFGINDEQFDSLWNWAVSL